MFWLLADQGVGSLPWSPLAKGRLSVDAGGFYSGTRRSLEATATLRAGRILRMSPDYELNDVTLAEGAFTTHLFGLRTDVSFSRDAVASLFFQYNSDTRRTSSNIRFNFIHHPLSDLYVVYNDSRETTSGKPMERSFTIKLTNMFDF